VEGKVTLDAAATIELNQECAGSEHAAEHRIHCSAKAFSCALTQIEMDFRAVTWYA